MKLDPTAATVSLWLKNLDAQQLHEQGWIEINKRYHGIARAIRPFLRQQFPDEQDQKAAFDGFTLALMAMGHFEDIEQLSTLFTEQTSQTTPSTSPLILPEVASD
ncbi:MAG TPA: hypothetical protein VLH38_00120 [Patescibacteria group bacterium]|nr:hypothetical protein [Patescibacteria group bacterium]